LSADPYQASAGPDDPGSWNRYTYVVGDPVGFTDKEGLQSCPANTWVTLLHHSSTFSSMVGAPSWQSVENIDTQISTAQRMFFQPSAEGLNKGEVGTKGCWIGSFE
jgi:hypothetical protein